MNQTKRRGRIVDTTKSSPMMTMCITYLYLSVLILGLSTTQVNAKLADRGRLVKSRNELSSSTKTMNSRVYGTHTIPSRTRERELPIEGPKYRGKQRWEAEASNLQRARANAKSMPIGQLRASAATTASEESATVSGTHMHPDDFERHLGSQLTGCCTTFSSYSADNMCYKYGENCATGAMPSHDSGDEDCEMAGLSFIGISFSVNTAYGNPYSYQLCDQLPMENIIDRNYDYVMSMDEDGWLVGGGYKSFDYSGKMPYIDSSHTELLRIGSLDPEYG